MEMAADKCRQAAHPALAPGSRLDQSALRGDHPLARVQIVARAGELDASEYIKWTRTGPELDGVD